MDQQRAPSHPPFDQFDVDDTPGLSPRDESALEVIRRQLAEEYAEIEVPSLALRDDPALARRDVATPARRARAGRWPLVAGLVALGAVGGGAVGAALTVHMLGKPEGLITSSVRPEPAVAPAPEIASVPAAPSQVDTASEPASVTAPRRPPEALASRVELPAAAARAGRPVPAPRAELPAPAARSERSAPAGSLQLPRPPTRETPAETRAAGGPETGRQTAAAPREIPAGSPPRGDASIGRTVPPAASPATAPSPAAGAPRDVPRIAGPEPERWSDPFQPLNAEAAAHAGVAKAAFRSSAASPVPPPAPPPASQPLVAPPGPGNRAVAAPAPDTPRTPPPVPRRDEGLLTTIREDWKTVKRGFASAPDDFKDAWQSLTRDLKRFWER